MVSWVYPGKDEREERLLSFRRGWINGVDFPYVRWFYSVAGEIQEENRRGSLPEQELPFAGEVIPPLFAQYGTIAKGIL